MQRAKGDEGVGMEEAMVLMCQHRTRTQSVLLYTPLTGSISLMSAITNSKCESCCRGLEGEVWKSLEPELWN